MQALGARLGALAARVKRQLQGLGGSDWKPTTLPELVVAFLKTLHGVDEREDYEWSPGGAALVVATGVLIDPLPEELQAEGFLVRYSVVQAELVARDKLIEPLLAHHAQVASAMSGLAVSVEYQKVKEAFLAVLQDPEGLRRAAEDPLSADSVTGEA
ncbi:hypothetical protein [Ottowia sp.]|uniref:hypothetical protein n=1 Tax=Ottowia sp. TaxID=1898956 RepID=UPI002601521B|nr:hypothetical protein [Ottowia sp.]MBK6616287.1 hypothetical protein [Ottowia sp.]